MANRSRISGGGVTINLALLCLLFLTLTLTLTLTLSSASYSSPHFEGFGDELDEIEDDPEAPIQLTDLPPSPSLTQSDSSSSPQTTTPTPSPSPSPSPSQPSPSPKPSSASHFDFWDEDEFEGIPTQQQQQQQQLPPPSSLITPDPTPSTHTPEEQASESTNGSHSESSQGFIFRPSKWLVEISCGTFLLIFLINYFTGKKENENLALAWAAKFATKDSIFDKNFSLLGVGEGDDSPLLLKEGQNVFKFYASGRRYCQGLLATMELKSRHDLISRIYNTIVPCKDEISFEVYMNDEAMDQVVFAVAKKKQAKMMLKEVPDLQRFATLVAPPSQRKWVSDELTVISESKEVAGDLITETVLDQLEEAKRSRGERVEDGTAQRDRPLFEILKENKDKRDAEFNERFKHRPPKALDEDETEFLDKLETSRKEYEQQIADEEARELRMFQAAVEAQTRVMHETKEMPPVSGVQQEKRAVGKKNTPVQPLGMIIKVKPPGKKAKVDPSLGSQSGVEGKMSAGVQKCSSPGKRHSDGEKPKQPLEISDDNEDIPNVKKACLVSYSDESDDD